jgi:hypothetical protein
MDQDKLEEIMEFLKAIERKREADKAKMDSNQAESEAVRKADKEESMAKMECLLADNREMKATIRSA